MPTPMVGWATVYSNATTSLTSTYPSTYQTVSINPYTGTGDGWLVQYTTTSAVPPPWQILGMREVIVRANPWAYLTAVEVPRWEPAAPAVIRQSQERVAAERQAARARARELLIGELDPVQRAQFETEGYFEHIGRRGVRYRINNGISANIEVRRRGRVRERLCVHPVGAYRMPSEDTMLAQLLHLRDDEQNLLRIANHHPALAA